MTVPLDLAYVPYEKYIATKNFIAKMPRFSVATEATTTYERELVTDIETGVIVAIMYRHLMEKRPRYQLHRALLKDNFTEKYRQHLKDLTQHI